MHRGKNDTWFMKNNGIVHVLDWIMFFYFGTYWGIEKERKMWIKNGNSKIFKQKLTCTPFCTQQNECCLTIQ